MVDRAPIETVEDVRKAIFSLTNLTLKLEREFTEWQEGAFGPNGSGDFKGVADGLRTLNYFTAIMLEDVSVWCCANMPPQEPIQRTVELWTDAEGAPSRPWRGFSGDVMVVEVAGMKINVRAS